MLDAGVADKFRQFGGIQIPLDQKLYTNSQIAENAAGRFCYSLFVFFTQIFIFMSEEGMQAFRHLFGNGLELAIAAS
ncbi:MAG: hypothetical protein ONB46_02640 [candidate division KSB1 bacterium]|nr:hypothetical protein [candidate division KSB1 bacterium]MDZ7364867.1 hypothetical protein [candidate division KSB1 bacterium]MDZ7402970.1 hypothetical protein [candidate division KSB1 bacterium]